MKIALCNEVLAPMPFARQCEFAGERRLRRARDRAVHALRTSRTLMSGESAPRSAAPTADAGLAITGCTGCCVAPKGLSITQRRRCGARAHGRRHAAAGRSVRGARRQRAGARLARPAAGPARASRARRRSPARSECFAAAGEAGRARRRRLLHRAARAERDRRSINTVAEAAAIVDAVGESRGCARWSTPAPPGQSEARAGRRAASTAGCRPAASRTCRSTTATGAVPAKATTGSRRCSPPCSAHGYDGVVAVEPFKYVPDGPACAARSIGYRARHPGGALNGTERQLEAAQAARTGAGARARAGAARRAGRRRATRSGRAARILEAATKEFARFGLGGARVDRIAARAGREQADALLLLRRQGGPLSRGARAHLRGHPRRRAGAAPPRRAAGRGDRAPGRVHLALLPRASRVPDPAQQRESPPCAAPQALEGHPGDELAADRDARRDPAPRRGARACSAPASTRCSSTSPSPRSPTSILSNNHTLSQVFDRDLATAGRARRAPRAHDRARHRLSD